MGVRIRNTSPSGVETADQHRLRQLVQTLDYGERQAACALFQSRNDIVMRLPFELLLELFSHLDLRDAWTLQLVNREWRQKLSSDRFLRATLSRWDTHDPTDSARSQKILANETTRSKTRHCKYGRL